MGLLRRKKKDKVKFTLPESDSSVDVDSKTSDIPEDSE